MSVVMPLGIVQTICVLVDSEVLIAHVYRCGVPDGPRYTFIWLGTKFVPVDTNESAHALLAIAAAAAPLNAIW